MKIYFFPDNIIIIIALVIVFTIINRLIYSKLTYIWIFVFLMLTIIKNIFHNKKMQKYSFVFKIANRKINR